MADFQYSVYLGYSAAELAELYSYEPGAPGQTTLDEQIEHFVRQTLLREGIDVTVTSYSQDRKVSLSKSGISDAEQQQLWLYVREFEPRYVRMLRNAKDALAVVPIIKARGPRVRQDEKPWDPELSIHHRQELAWRPFFGHGLPIVEPRCVQLFHYPPLRLLQKYRDYLDDPVPRKVEILLVANQSFDDLLAQSDKPASELQNKPPYRLALYERVIDSCPVAAPDDQGSKPVVDAQGQPICDENGVQFVGFMPYEDFLDYQRDELKLHLIPHATQGQYTIPMNIFGDPARLQFQKLTGVQIDKEAVAARPVVGVANLMGSTLKTPYIAWWHPYEFYWRAHGRSSQTIGGGKLIMTQASRLDIEGLLIDDLALAGFTLSMVENPGLGVEGTLKRHQQLWNSVERAPQVQALVRHLASFAETGEDKLGYEFRESLTAAWDYVRANPSKPYGDLPPG